jgi:hypothetical protein
MHEVLRVWEEGDSALFLISEAGPVGGRVFLRRGHALEVRDEAQALLHHLLLAPNEWSVLNDGRVYWLECRADRLALQITIAVTDAQTLAP